MFVLCSYGHSLLSVFPQFFFCQLFSPLILKWILSVNRFKVDTWVEQTKSCALELSKSTNGTGVWTRWPHSFGSGFVQHISTVDNLQLNNFFLKHAFTICIKDGRDVHVNLVQAYRKRLCVRPSQQKWRATPVSTDAFHSFHVSLLFPGNCGEEYFVSFLSPWSLSFRGLTKS